MIDLLKSQVQVKDGQIRELTDHNRNLSDTNLKLIGRTVQQANEIQTRLRLTGGNKAAKERAAGAEAPAAEESRAATGECVATSPSGSTPRSWRH